MSSADVFCRDASLAASEPLYGTAASDTDLWVVLEVNTPWGAKGLEDSGIPESVVSRLHRFVKASRRARVQLIRRPERVSRAVRLYLASSSEHGAALYRVPISTLEDVVALDLEGFAEGKVPAGAERVSEPLYLVCVHGKRDRCCAQHGMPLYSALCSLEPEHTFQTTHLGGHRFAATMLVLPAGVCYGRVLDSEAQAIVKAHRTGELYDLDRLRGRTSYAPAVQAADYWLRKQLGETRLSGLSFESVVVVDGTSRVTFRDAASALHSIDVGQETLGDLIASCGAKPKPAEKFVPLRLGADR